MEMMASLGKFETLKFSRVAQIGNRDFGKWPETRVFILLICNQRNNADLIQFRHKHNEENQLCFWNKGVDEVDYI